MESECRKAAGSRVFQGSASARTSVSTRMVGAPVMTGGQYVPLRNADLLAKVIVGSAQEEISLERLLAEAEQEVRAQQQSGVVDEEALARAVETSLKS